MTDRNPVVEVTSATSDFNALQHAINTVRDAMMTCTIVKVMKAPKNANSVAPIGQIDVMPLVQMVDGVAKTYDHVTVFQIPYIRMLGSGTNAVILDPAQGDLGIVVTADRDTSGVRQKMDKAPPGSGRRYNISDGIYIGACLSKDKPKNYVRFVDTQTLELSPDGGVTSIWLRPNRIDLGMKDAPHMVMTVDGPSQKVFAVISESGQQD